jgi:hypothetical protein
VLAPPGSGPWSPPVGPAPRPEPPVRPRHTPLAGDWRRARRWVLLGAVIFAVYVAGPARFDGDSYYAYATATAVVHHRSLDLSTLALPAGDPRLMQLGDQRLDFFPWTVSLVAVPAVLALDLAHGAGIGPGAGDLAVTGVLVVEMLLGSLLVALAAVLTGVAAGALVRDARHRRLVGVAAALILAFATGAWSTASRSLNQHAPSLALLAGALVVAVGLGQGRAARPRVAAAGLGLLVAAAYTVRPTNALVAAAVLVWLALGHRRLLVPFAAGAAAVAVPWLVVNQLTYGTLLPPYFAGDRLHPGLDSAGAAAANLVSPNRGLLVFSPLIVVLAVAGTIRAVRGGAGLGRSLRRLAALLAGAVAAQWIAVSTFPHWWAGYSYGPRFLTEAMVPMAVLAAPALERIGALTAWSWRERRGVLAAVAVLAVWSVGAHAQPAFLPRSHCWNATPDIDTHPERVWDWSDPQLLAGARSVRLLTAEGVLRSYAERSLC